jgi:hypothetical protein
VRQLARLSETGKERLARLPRAFLSLGPIRLEQIPAALGKDDRAVVRAECRRAQQTLSFEVTLGSAGVLAAVVEIALGHNPKGADGGEHPALGAVDLVHSVTFSYRTAIAASWEVEVLREDVSRIVLVWAITFAGSARAAATSIAKVNVLAFRPAIEGRIGPTWLLLPPAARHKRRARDRCFEYESQYGRWQSIIGCFTSVEGRLVPSRSIPCVWPRADLAWPHGGDDA